LLCQAFDADYHVRKLFLLQIDDVLGLPDHLLLLVVRVGKGLQLRPFQEELWRRASAHHA
jgi:hypothetical protein